MSWTIRPIKADEVTCILGLLEEVHALHVQAHPGHYRANLNCSELSVFLSDWLSRDEITALVAFESDGSALGYLIFEIENRVGSPLRYALHRGMLHHISVDKFRRRSGIGLALIDNMKARLREKGIARVATVYGAFNEPSASLMRKAGLEPLSVVAEGPT